MARRVSSNVKQVIFQKAEQAKRANINVKQLNIRNKVETLNKTYIPVKGSLENKVQGVCEKQGGLFDGAINLIKSIDYKEVAIAALSATASAVVGYFTGWNPILMGATYGAADGFVRGIVNNQSKEEIIANTIIGGAIGGVFAYGIGALGNVAQGVLPKIAETTFGKAVNSGITKVVNSKVGSALNSITNSFIGRNILESTVETSISTISSKVRGEEVSFGQVATNFVSNLLTNSIFDYGTTLNKNKVKASDTNVEVEKQVNKSIKENKTTEEILKDIAKEVNTEIEGKGPVVGTKKHSLFKKKLEALDLPNIKMEQTYLEGIIQEYGTKGAVRVDVIETLKYGSIKIYDLKTGSAKLTEARIKQIQKMINPKNPNSVKVIEIK